MGAERMKLTRKQSILRSEFQRVLIAVKRSTHWPDFTESGDPGIDGLGFLCVTFGANRDLSDWGCQTGDNSYSGDAYGFRHWGVVWIRPRSNCRHVALEALEQILDSIAQSQEALS